MIGQRRVFCSPIDAVEIWILSENSLAGEPHFSVWLDAKYFVALLQKQFAKQSRSRAQIGDYRRCRQSTFTLKKIDNPGRITGTVLQIILNTVGKAFGWIQHGFTGRFAPSAYEISPEASVAESATEMRNTSRTT